MWKKLNNNIINLYNYFMKMDLPPMLGRWCHKGIPNCNDSVIEKKIQFAQDDNSYCTKIYYKLYSKSIISTKNRCSS